LELGFALAHLIQLQRICDETEMGKSLSGLVLRVWRVG